MTDLIRRQLSRLRKQPLLLFGAALLILAIIICDALLISRLKESTLDSGQRESRNLSFVLAEQTDRSFQSVNLVISRIRDTLESGLSIAELQQTTGPEQRNFLHEK